MRGSRRRCGGRGDTTVLRRCRPRRAGGGIDDGLILTARGYAAEPSSASTPSLVDVVALGLVVVVPAGQLGGTFLLSVELVVGLAGADLGQRPLGLDDIGGGLGCGGHAHDVLGHLRRLGRGDLAKVGDTSH